MKGQMILSPKGNASFLLSFHSICCCCYILLEVSIYFSLLQKTLTSSCCKAQCGVGWGLQQLRPSPGPAFRCSVPQVTGTFIK